MKRLSIIVIFSLGSLLVLSQKSEIKNTRITISPSTDTMNVKYDLIGKKEAFITLEVKDQNNRIIKPKNVHGDIGKRIPPGNDKSIVWDMNADGLDLSGSSLKVNVKGSLFTPASEIKIRYTPPKWGFSLTLSSGYGFFTDDLEKTYRFIIPIVADFDFYYKRLALYLRDYIGISETLHDIPYSGGIWAEGSRADVINAEASLGYILAFRKKSSLTAFAGIGGTEIGPTEDELNKTPGLNEVKLEFTTTYTLGLNYEYRFGSSGNAVQASGLKWSSWFIRARYSYNIPQYDDKYAGFGGNFHSLTIGVGGFGGRY